MHKLEAVKLSKTIKSTQIVREVSLEVKSGEIVGLLGPNGAGKTTSFYMICGLIEATGGQVIYDGEDISDMPLHKRANRGIGYLPQESSVFKDLSVEENLMLAAEIVYEDERVQQEKVEHLLELLNIEPIRGRKGVSLSGGERRRCEIARALMLYPNFLLLDEPFAGVDPIAVNDIQSIIAELKELDIGVLITDHNVRETLTICDRAYVMNEGVILASGTSEEVYNCPLVKKHYLGENFSI
jgi:lipopolysaccharide export system ATP-binding protein